MKFKFKTSFFSYLFIAALIWVGCKTSKNGDKIMISNKDVSATISVSEITFKVKEGSDTIAFIYRIDSGVSVPTKFSKTFTQEQLKNKSLTLFNPKNSREITLDLSVFPTTTTTITIYLDSGNKNVSCKNIFGDANTYYNYSGKFILRSPNNNRAALDVSSVVDFKTTTISEGTSYVAAAKSRTCNKNITSFVKCISTRGNQAALRYSKNKIKQLEIKIKSYSDTKIDVVMDDSGGVAACAD